MKISRGRSLTPSTDPAPFNTPNPEITPCLRAKLCDLYIKVPYSVRFRFAALSIVGLGLGLVVGLGSVLVYFFGIFWFRMYVKREKNYHECTRAAKIVTFKECEREQDITDTSSVARICCEEGQSWKLGHRTLTADFRAGCSSVLMTNSFVTNAVLIERAVSC